ncbi:MAG TPA: hypothetical protein VGR35_18755, partial [Tepidisphaeraceae bacterium]|nr:hypothetical protein [Tepidisphaeraceae bacterium]
LTTTTSSSMPLPAARRAIAIRVATMADLPFLDSLQKKHNKALGYFPTKQFEGYIEMGAVLVARATRPCDDAANMGESPMPLLGYIIARDRYLKRDELGVVYQLCVVQGDQRKLIGASLIKAVFERAAYGCRLFCCWCAQDLDANYFWESIEFVPIAFRGGSGKKKRVHIFWQRRIRENDATTPWWFPAKTDQGAMRADRIVFPIPPGLHWRDEMPVMVGESAETGSHDSAEQKPRAKSVRKPKPEVLIPPTKRRPRQFAPPTESDDGAEPAVEKPKPEKKPKPPAAKIDPKYLAAARELRDRYLERVNEDPQALTAVGKYDVARALARGAASCPSLAVAPRKALPQAA